jgi:cell division protein FtsN
LGVNVGRGVRTAVGDTDVITQADAPPTKVPDEPAATGDAAKPAEPELSYHDMLLGTASGDKTPPAEAPPPINEAPPDLTATPTPRATPTPAAATPAPTQSPAAEPKVTTGAWFLQVGAYSTRAVADGQVAKLKQLNAPAFSDVSGKLFRVRVGPYTDRAEAEQVKGRIARQGFTSSITR